MIYHGMYIERHDTDFTLIGPCCNSIHEKATNDQVSFESNPLLLKIREENRQGVWSNTCSSCARNEKFGFKSYRTAVVEDYKDKECSGLIRLDYNVDPICNGKCIICSPYHSSAWRQEQEKFKDIKVIRTAASSRSNKVIDNIDLSSLEYIYFNGGEPVLSTDPELILGKLKDIGRLSEVTVSFNMNGSTRPRRELVDLLQQAKEVDIMFSVDAVGEQFEYIRNPIKWDTVLDTIRYVANLPIKKLRIGSSCAIGLHNVDYVEEWHSWWDEYTTELVNNNSRTSPLDVVDVVQLVHGELAISHAPKVVKEQWLGMLEQSKHRSWYPLVVGAIQESLNNTTNRSWVNYLDKLDHRRNNSWKLSLNKFYQRCITSGIVK